MKIKFVPQDVWVGLYWKTVRARDIRNECDGHQTTWYLCVLPCLPIIWTTFKESKNERTN